jgi:L-fucose isomerase-like protein
VRGLREPAHRRAGRAPHRVQHRSLQREAPRAAGISVETLDLSEVFGRINMLDDDDAAVRPSWQVDPGLRPPAKGVPAARVIKMAKFGVVSTSGCSRPSSTATAIQCWTAMEEFYGVVPCTLMSMQ